MELRRALKCITFLAEMQKVVDEVSLRLKNVAPKHIPLPSASTKGSSSSGTSVGMGMRPMTVDQGTFLSKKRRGESAIEKAFNLGAREELHGEIARMFYSAGLSFHLARNPHYVRSYTFAANNMINGYIPPGYNLLRTSLLQKERANVERLLEPIKGTWKENGVSIVCDGWTDA